MLMHNALQEYIDNLDETDREEVDQLKAQFLANEEAYRRAQTAPHSDGAAGGAPPAATHVPLATRSPRHR